MPSGPGCLSLEQIRRLAALVPPGVDSFLLSSATAADALLEQLRFCRPSVLQLVDRVDSACYKALREDCPGLRIVQVIHVQDKSALALAKQLQYEVDALLLDSGKPTATIPTLGGTGNTHDWRLSAAIVQAVSCPVWLAGGLHPQNLRAALEQVRPFGVDVCSGLRRSGQLDAELLREFCHSLHAAP